MKVAVQIFGHLRTFERCAPSLKENLLDHYPDHDLFLHTWDRLEAETITPHERSCMPSPVDDQTIGAIERLYHPRRTLIEHQPPRDLGELTFSNGKRIAISGIGLDPAAALTRLMVDAVLPQFVDCSCTFW